MRVNSVTIDTRHAIRVSGSQVGAEAHVILTPCDSGHLTYLWIDGATGPAWLRQLADAIEAAVLDAKVSDADNAGAIARVNESPVPAKLEEATLPPPSQWTAEQAAAFNRYGQKIEAPADYLTGIVKAHALPTGTNVPSIATPDNLKRLDALADTIKAYLGTNIDAKG